MGRGPEATLDQPAVAGSAVGNPRKRQGWSFPGGRCYRPLMSKQRSRRRGRSTRGFPTTLLRRGLVALLGITVITLAALHFLHPGPAVFGEKDRPGERWNVLLVSLDTTRPDYLHACGVGPVPTPALDRVRGDGFVFSSMISPAPITLPSHASLLTGKNPNRHGVRENTEYALPERETSIAEVLARSGYRTQAFVSTFILDARFGLAQGFSAYVDDLSGPDVPIETTELTGAITAGRATEWISRYASARRSGREDRPFFLFLHLFDAHAPYAPPSPYREAFASDPYAGELAYQDACLGLVLDRLEAEGEASRTLVWVVSDHGESRGAHGEETHSLFIYDVTQRAVSLLRLPPAENRYRAEEPRMVIDDVTALVDVGPTLLDLLALPPLPEVDGKSAIPLLRGERDPDRVVYCEAYSPFISYRWSPLLGVRSHDWKYIRAPYPELYDLLADPGEERNLASARPEIARGLSAQLDTFLGSAPDSAGANAYREASEEEIARLRSLGYIAGTRRSQAEENVDMSALPDPKRQIAFFRQSFQTAQALLLRGKTADAIAEFEEAARLDPGNPSIHQHLGVAYRQAGDFEAATRSYRTALALQPALPRSWVGLGRAQLSREFPDSAKSAFETALSLLPSSPDPWEGLGDVAWAKGDILRAAALLDSARVRGSPPIIIEGKLARLYRDDLPDPSRARQHLEAFARALGTDTETAITRLPKSERP